MIERNVDLLITRKSGPIDERLDYELLFDDSYSIVVGAQNPWARRRKVELGELVSEPWVLPPADSVLGLVAMRAFRASRLDYPHTTVVAEPAEVRMSLLASHRFVSIFPDSVLRFSGRRAELRILPVKQSLGRVPIGIVTLKNRTISSIAQRFIDNAREAAGSLCPVVAHSGLHVHEGQCPLMGGKRTSSSRCVCLSHSERGQAETRQLIKKYSFLNEFIAGLPDDAQTVKRIR